MAKNAPKTTQPPVEQPKGETDEQRDARIQAELAEKEAAQRKAESGDRVADFKRLADVRNLPEVSADAELERIGFEPGSIERFIAGEDDRRVMQVVGFSGGFAAQAVADEA